MFRYPTLHGHSLQAFELATTNASPCIIPISMFNLVFSSTKCVSISSVCTLTQQSHRFAHQSSKVFMLARVSPPSTCSLNSCCVWICASFCIWFVIRMVFCSLSFWSSLQCTRESARPAIEPCRSACWLDSISKFSTTISSISAKDFQKLRRTNLRSVVSKTSTHALRPSHVERNDERTSWALSRCVCLSGLSMPPVDERPGEGKSGSKKAATWNLWVAQLEYGGSFSWQASISIMDTISAAAPPSKPRTSDFPYQSLHPSREPHCSPHNTFAPISCSCCCLPWYRWKLLGSCRGWC